MDTCGVGWGGRGVGEVRPNHWRVALGQEKNGFYAVLYSLFQKHFSRYYWTEYMHLYL